MSSISKNMTEVHQQEMRKAFSNASCIKNCSPAKYTNNEVQKDEKQFNTQNLHLNLLKSSC